MPDGFPDYSGNEPNRILCFGDSNTWGYTPKTGARFSHSVRWPGRLEYLLNDDQTGQRYRVIEEGLNGRTTQHNEDGRLCRSGKDMFPVLLESHGPLDFVIVSLGTNDLKPQFASTPKEIARGAGDLCELAMESVGYSTSVLLVSPTHLNITEVNASDEYGSDFAEAIARSKALGEQYKAVAEDLEIHYLDAAKVVKTNTADGVHWDEAQHKDFASAVMSFMLNWDCLSFGGQQIGMLD